MRFFLGVTLTLAGLAAVGGSLAFLLILGIKGVLFKPSFWFPDSAFTSQNIRLVKQGDSFDDVKSLLGNPISESKETLEFSKIKFFPPGCPVVWVHFTDVGEVASVYSKTKMFCFSDESPYGMGRDGDWIEENLMAAYFD